MKKHGKRTMQRIHFASRPVFGLLIILASPLLMGSGSNSYEPPSSEPRNLHVYKDYIYFSANDGIHGRELWRVDIEGNAQMVCDMTRGPAEVEIDNFREFKGILFFRVSTGKDEGDLWRTDGTPEETRIVRSFGKALGGLGINSIVATDAERLYFVVGEAHGSGTLWSSDGTGAGTYPVHPGEDYYVLNLPRYSGLVHGGVHYFSAGNHHIAALWRTNGIKGTTREVLPISGGPTYFCALDDRRFIFSGDDDVHGRELWISEGTAESTRMLKDIYPGPETSDPRESSRIVTPEGVPLVLFAATTPDTGRELWETDGTPEGTRLRADLFPGTGSSSPSRVVEVEGIHYLIAVGDGVGKELWRSNVSLTGYELPRDIAHGPAGSEPYALCRVGPRLYFSALTGEHGEELWCVEHVKMEPTLVADFYPGPGNSYPYYTIKLQEKVVTVATSPVHGRELWISNGIGPEMVLLADINTDNSVNPSSFPGNLTAAGEVLYFTANDIEHGTELWRTDGTETGTVLVKDIYSGTPSSDPAELIAVGTLLYFSADDGAHGTELWRSDGTTAGTSLVHDIHPDGSANPRNLTVLKDMLIFSAFEPRDGEELWILEPGNQPKLLKSIAATSASSSPSDLFVWKDHVYFQADDGVRGRELWRTDGTMQGTVLVRDVVTAPFEKLSFHSPRAHHGVLYFASDLDGRGGELWKLDESTNQLQLVRDIVGPDAYDVVNRIVDKPVVER
jgi:ELWxxDGT repeat protein